MEIKTDFPKMLSDQFQHDMGPWLSEKSEAALKALIELRKDIRNIKSSIDQTTLGYIDGDLSDAIFQLTKIYSFSVGSKWELGDEDFIFCELDDGLEKLQVKYGLLDKTTQQIHYEKIQNFYNKIAEYLEMEQYPGRSLLQELFENYLYLVQGETLSGRLLKKIDSNLWAMANEGKPWVEFTAEAKKILADIRKMNLLDLSLIPSRKRKWDPCLNDFI